MSARLSAEKARLKYLLWSMIEIHQPNCWLCGQPFQRDAVLPSRGVDLLTEHHKDGNHQNMSVSNRCLVHRLCHKSFHTKDNICRR